MQTAYAEATNFNWHSISQNLGEGYGQNLNNQLSSSLASDLQSPSYQNLSSVGYADPNLNYTTTTTSNLGYGSSSDPIVANTQYQTQFDRKVSDFASQGTIQESGAKLESKDVLKDQSKLQSKDLSMEKSKEESKILQKELPKTQSLQQQTTTQQTFTQQQTLAQPQTSYLNAPLMSSYAWPTTSVSTNYSAMPAGVSYWAYPVLFPGTSTMFEDKIIEIYYPPRQRRGLFGRKKAANVTNAYSYPMAPGGFQTLAPPLTTNAPFSTFNAPLTTWNQPLSSMSSAWNPPLTTSLNPLNASLNPPFSTPMAAMNPMNQLNPFTTASNVPMQSAAPIRAM